MDARTGPFTQIGHGAMYAAAKLCGSFTVELRAIRQLNGDLRIDDAEEDGPMLKIEFFDVWARDLTDEEKESILEAVVDRMGEIFQDRDVE